MAGPQTKIVIGGDASGALQAIQQTKAALSSAGAQFSGAFAPLTAGVNGFQAALAGLSAALAGGAIFKASLSAANEWNATVGKIARSMGTTSEKASVMAVAMERLGIESDTVVKATIAMTRQLGSNEEAFQRLGVQTRDLTTGALLPAGQIMNQVNQRLSEIDNATARNLAGLQIYGRAWYEVQSVLKITGEQLTEAEKRARDLGLVVGSDNVSASRQFKLQLADLSLVSKSLQVRLGNELLPTFVQFGAWVSKEGPTIGRVLSSIFDVAASGAQIAWYTIKDVGNALAAFGASAAALLRGDLAAFGAIREARDEEAARNVDAVKSVLANVGKIPDKEAEIANERRKLQTDLQAALGNLEFLRAVAAGKASRTIVEDDEKQTAERIKNAEKLRDALRSAWESTVSDARKAGEEATKLIDKAGQTRETGRQSAEEIRRGTLDQATQDYLNQRESQDRATAAVQAALQAKLAANYGRTENAAKLADQATKEAERAARLVEKIVDPEQKAKLVEQIADAQASADEARAKMKQDEATQATERAAAIQKNITDLDAQITQLQGKAAAIALQVEISQAEQAITSIQQQLEAIQDKTVTVTVKQVTEGGSLANDLAQFDAAAAASGYSRGGFTGHGGKFDPAGIVHRGEFVVPAEIVGQRGALTFLQRLLRYGVTAIPGYADGGLVGRLSMPSLSPQPTGAARATAVFNFPGMGSYTASMDKYNFDTLQRDFARAALKWGGRR